MEISVGICNSETLVLRILFFPWSALFNPWDEVSERMRSQDGCKPFSIQSLICWSAQKQSAIKTRSRDPRVATFVAFYRLDCGNARESNGMFRENLYSYNIMAIYNGFSLSG